MRRLLRHPEFPAARASAPGFSRDALETVSRLEYDLELERGRK